MSSSYAARIRRVQQYVNGNDLGQPVDTNEGSVTGMKRTACNDCASSELLGPFSSGPRVMNTAAVISLKNWSNPIVKLSPHDTSGKTSIGTLYVECQDKDQACQRTLTGEDPTPLGNTCSTTSATCNIVKNMNVQPASMRTRGVQKRAMYDYLVTEQDGNKVLQRPSQSSRDKCF